MHFAVLPDASTVKTRKVRSETVTTGEGHAVTVVAVLEAEMTRRFVPVATSVS